MDLKTLAYDFFLVIRKETIGYIKEKKRNNGLIEI